MGTAVTQDVRALRINLHALVDPLWNGDSDQRRALYAAIEKQLGYENFHISQLGKLELEDTIFFIEWRYYGRHDFAEIAE